MPDPYTISEALEILNSGHGGERSLVSVDVLGLVVGVSLLQSPQRSSLQKADIWISDASVAFDVRVRVTLQGTSQIARVIRDQVSVNDILRFNKISRGFSDSQNIEFVYPRERAGPCSEWFRLGRIDLGDFVINETIAQFPEDMLVSGGRMEQLVQWSQKNRTVASKAGLSPLPCRHRELREIQFSVGLLSNVTVRVTHYECRQVMQSPVSRMRKAPGASLSVGFASLTDKFGSMMSFVDTTNRFGKVLERVNEHCKLVMLTNLSSRDRSGIDKRLFDPDEVVLIPTDHSVAIVLEDDEASRNHYSLALTDRTAFAISQGKDISVISSMSDIAVGGVSLFNQKTLKSPTEFLADTLLTADGQYPSLEIRLGAVSLGLINYPITVRPTAVQALFGGIEAAEFEGDASLMLHASRFVLALVKERIRLLWTIDMVGGIPEVNEVTMIDPALP